MLDLDNWQSESKNKIRLWAVDELIILSLSKDANKKYGAKAWSSMVVKRLEDSCNINFRANGYPEELVDNEKEEKGYEI